MFYIDYKTDGQTAYTKQMRGEEYVCEAPNGAKIYAKANDEGDYREWFYSVEGYDGMLREFQLNGWTPVDEAKTLIEQLSIEKARRCFPNRTTLLELIAEAVQLGKWTSNGDALFCEMCGDYVLAESVRKNREEYRQKQQAERAKEDAERERKRIEQKEAERQKEEQMLEQAERDLRAGKYITAAHFEQLAERYGVALPIKLVGWLREHCGSIRLEAHPECGGYFTQYYYDKGHKSTSIATYGDKLGKAMAI